MSIIIAVIFIVIIAFVYEITRPKSIKELKTENPKALVVDSHSPYNHLHFVSYNTYNSVSYARIGNDILHITKEIYTPFPYNLRYITEEIFYHWAQVEKGIFPNWNEPKNIDETKTIPLFIYTSNPQPPS